MAFAFVEVKVYRTDFFFPFARSNLHVVLVWVCQISLLVGYNTAQDGRLDMHRKKFKQHRVLFTAIPFLFAHIPWYIAAFTPYSLWSF